MTVYTVTTSDYESVGNTIDPRDGWSRVAYLIICCREMLRDKVKSIRIALILTNFSTKKKLLLTSEVMLILTKSRKSCCQHQKLDRKKPSNNKFFCCCQHLDA